MQRKAAAQAAAALRSAARLGRSHRGRGPTADIAARCWHDCRHEHAASHMTEQRRLRVGQAITPEEFDELSDAQLERLVPKAWREFFPGKENCADGHFYLHDGTAWSFYKGDLLDG
jgi:hypothetical protein